MEDIEDTVIQEKMIAFTKELVEYTFKDEKEFTRICVELRRKYKVGPNKPQLRKIYNSLLVNNEITPNKSFLEYSLKRKCRSQSGVTVITILTSPTPEYTDKDGNLVKQSFSCGKNCAYCPNEPEISITLTVNEITEKNKQIKVYTKDNINIIRVLTYIVKEGGEEYVVNECSQFKEDNFTITFEKSIEHIFTIGEIITGVKVEQPRSYLSTEPAVLRANRNKFNPILQIYDRAEALHNCGHEVDKIEMLVLGGTWDHYPIEYQNEFIRDIYYGINTLSDKDGRKKLSLDEEITVNQTSQKRLIGLTLETRPDCITIRQIKKLRKYNVTRLQIGVQHIDDDILNIIERDSSTNDTIFGNYLWKQNGGKVDWHLMPDLPGSSVEKDIDMFRKIFGVNSITEISQNHFVYDLQYPELQADQLKIYPCSVVDWTKIKEWYDNGTYQPYAEDEDELIKVIVFIKKNIFPWIRLNRIVRDIPNINILGGNDNVNLRQKILARKDVNCPCIRCREAKNNKNIREAQLFIREYNGVNSTEYFISYESPDQHILYGFLRLRINHSNEDLIYDDLIDCGLVRELHVYGQVVRHDEQKNEVQHQGIGKKLLQKAEEITMNHNIFKVAIISGVGVRGYYQKQGYELVKNYMIKSLYEFNVNYTFEAIILITIFILFISIFYDTV
jgi:ELP3 family radical SAM enzyme/protein acetyltransferase